MKITDEQLLEAANAIRNLVDTEDGQAGGWIRELVMVDGNWQFKSVQPKAVAILRELLKEASDSGGE